MNDRAVLVMAGSLDDRIWIFDRSMSSMGASAWTFPSPMTAPGTQFSVVPPLTGEVPIVAIDAFNTSSVVGRIAWYDSERNHTFTSWLTRTGTSYVMTNDHVPVSDGSSNGFTDQQARSFPIIDFEQTAVLGFGIDPRNSNDYESMLVDNLAQPPGAQTLREGIPAMTSYPNSVSRFSGAASNRLVVQTAFISTTVVDPN